jgi:proton-translocating NADH-quinone oxidoreductase chain M
MISNLLIYLIISIFILFIIPNYKIKYLKIISFSITLGALIFSLILWLRFNNNIIGFQELEYYYYKINLFNLTYSLGIDGISLFFILLTTLLIPLCILASWNSIKYRLKEFLLLMLIIEFLLINVFCVLDILFFYIFFESILIPMFLLIGIWGSRTEKINAAFQFVLYTLFGSVLMLLAIILIYFHLGTTDYDMVLTTTYSKSRQIILWLAFFASFAVKTPMLPFHIWLPKAHVEAPTAGSVLLAGVLLKMGTYGFIRFSLPLFPYASQYFTPLIYVMSILAIIYSSLTTIRQIDLKRIIAYSSVAHMNFVLVGLFSNNLQAVEGSIILMLGHGLVSSGLFLAIGFLYDRYHTRILRYYSGLITIMPVYGIILFILILANISLPTTSNFIGEFLILLGTFKVNSSVAFFTGIGMILGGVYSMWLYNRIMFNTVSKSIIYYCDLNRREFFVFIPLLLLIFLMGIYPNIFLDVLHLSTIQVIY